MLEVCIHMNASNEEVVYEQQNRKYTSAFYTDHQMKNLDFNDLEKWASKICSTGSIPAMPQNCYH